MKKRFIDTVEYFRKLQVGKDVRDTDDEMLKDVHLGQVYKNLHDDEFLVKKFMEYRTYPSGEGYRAFVTVVRKRRFRKCLAWGSSVAAVVAVLLFGVWMYDMETVSSQTDGSLVLAEKNVIPAGVSKAQITLANGEVVHVDSDSLRFKMQDGMEISYTGGKVSYKNSEEVTGLVYNKLAVPVGGECYIVLDDGTGVWVNAASKLTYPVKFVGEERIVELEGEAYFEVTLGNKPFIVQTVCGNVRVHGTSFNVKSYAGEEKTYTTLVSGKVSCEYEDQTVELQPGEQAIVPKHGMMEKKEVNVAEYVGWKEGLYIFKKRSLGSIMNELARWYDIEVVYQDEGLKDIVFTGNLKRYDTINTFMKIIKRSGDVNYRVEGKTIILYR